MHTTLPTQFDAALSNIELNVARRARAIAAHTEVRVLLEADKQLCGWGVDTTLIGSYARKTSIYPGKDVDVFVKLADLDTTASPKEVYCAVRDVLLATYGDGKDGGRAHEQPRSIKIDFSKSGDFQDDDFHVDAVPAVRNGYGWAIPTKDRNRWTESTGRWVTTDPEGVAEKIRELNKSALTPQVNGQNALKPIIKLIRQTRRTHLGDKKPGGLYVELAVYDIWLRNVFTQTTWAELFSQTLRKLSERLEQATWNPILDPALNTPITPAPDDTDLQNAATLVGQLATLAEQALTLDTCPAAVNWRTILGENDKVGGNVFPLPPGCDATGRSIPAVTAVASTGSDAARGFGAHARTTRRP